MLRLQNIFSKIWFYFIEREGDENMHQIAKYLHIFCERFMHFEPLDHLFLIYFGCALNKWMVKIILRIGHHKVLRELTFIIAHIGKFSMKYIIHMVIPMPNLKICSHLPNVTPRKLKVAIKLKYSIIKTCITCMWCD